MKVFRRAMTDSIKQSEQKWVCVCVCMYAAKRTNGINVDNR